MELKFLAAGVVEYCLRSSNRTFMELKSPYGAAVFGSWLF